MQYHLTDLSPSELEEELRLKPYQCRQIFQWIHGKGVFDPDAMTDLSKANRERLSNEYHLPQLTVVDVSISPSTGTKKLLFQLRDGESVEAVAIPNRGRVTLCLSSQVGCAIKCAFCATGLDGLTRNLSPGEIVEQAVHLLRGFELQGRTPNIVFMGMGEPFGNYEAVARSVRLLMNGDGLGIGARKITVSTAGDLDGILRFTQEGWQIRLSVSLHAANNELRSELVPLNRKYSLKRLKGAVRNYVSITGRQVTFEWVLLDGVNDRPEDAAELVEFLGGIKASVNLIPYNPVDEFDFRRPSNQRCAAFRDALEKRGVQATLRLEKGTDIDAACGQLRRRHLTPAEPEQPG